ncbi:flagellar brake protein [Desulfovibrio sp. OttesenSCG-928-A18]|nr:flagellar brake protein [Desulfovibrio sp. OttesenSCG-928-A18]
MNAIFKRADAAQMPKQYQETMPKLDMALNTRVYVRLNPVSRQNVPLQGEFLGTSHYDFLILRLPSVPGLVKKLIPDTRVEVRYLANAAVTTFLTEIITYSFKPTLLLYTTYPDRMSILETRRYQRISCSLPASLFSQHGEGVGVLHDLSSGGCRVDVDLKGQSDLRRLKAGESLILQTVLSPQGKVSRVACVVRSTETSGSRLALGLAFDHNDVSFNNALDGYMLLLRSLE